MEKTSRMLQQMPGTSDGQPLARNGADDPSRSGERCCPPPEQSPGNQLPIRQRSREQFDPPPEMFLG